MIRPALARNKLADSSIWLRSAAGVANGDRNSVIANFYFGAFGNNYVDDGSIKRYRDYSSLPGFQIDEVSALNYVREMVEWKPKRRRAGGLEFQYPEPLQHDAVGRIRGGPRAVRAY
jgi:hypothetical protein